MIKLIVLSIVIFILGICSIIPAMFTAMTFDSPGSENNYALIGVAYSLGTFPIMCVLSIIIAWSMHFIGYKRYAPYIFYILCINLISFIISLSILLFNN